MATAKFKHLISVCEALGLQCRETKICLIYEGTANGGYRKIVIHLHSLGRDIATGTFHRYVKDLGFDSEKDFQKFLNSL